MRRPAAVLAGLMLLGFGSPAGPAAPATVVAIGASNTYGAGRRGGGVGTSEAFPAQLERMLKARGYDVRVINAGVPGDTTAGMLARLDSAVPEGARVVIIQPGGNDARR